MRLRVLAYATDDAALSRTLCLRHKLSHTEPIPYCRGTNRCTHPRLPQRNGGLGVAGTDRSVYALSLVRRQRGATPTLSAEGRERALFPLLLGDQQAAPVQRLPCLALCLLGHLPRLGQDIAAFPDPKFVDRRMLRYLCRAHAWVCRTIG